MRRALNWMAVVCVLVASQLAGASVAALGERVGAILNGVDQEGLTVAARVVDLETGVVIFEQNAELPVKPASNLKLLVTAAALDKLGPGTTLKTYLYLAGDDLLVVGTGDPGFGDTSIEQGQGRTMLSAFDDWAAALKAQGIQSIKGDLIYDDSAIGEVWASPTWSAGNLLQWYGAPTSGLNLNNNCIDLIVETIEGRPGIGRVSYLPDAAMIEVINRTGGEEPLRVDKTPSKPEYIVSGKVEGTRTFYKPVDDPGRFFAEALEAHLRRRGIDIQGEVVRRPHAGHLLGQAPVAVHETPLPSILERINSNSQNMMADALMRMAFSARVIEQNNRVAEDWEYAGRQVLGRMQAMGVPVHDARVVDGSGLSHDSRVTTMLLSELLQRMTQRQDFAVFFESLSVAGESGSLRSRMKEAAGNIRGKTGSISGVRSSSGYIDTLEGRRVAYAIIYNDIRGSTSGKVLDAMDDACLMIQRWPVDQWE